MKKHLILCFLLLVSLFSVAQQDPLYSQYINNMLLINPAYSGSTTDLNASVMYRKQWAGFEGSPVTMNASAHMALNRNIMGTGMIILQDQVGSNKTTEVMLTYGYHISLNKDIKLSLGLQAGYVNYYSDFSVLKINPADTKFANSSEWKPNVGAGFMIRNEVFMLGFSIPKFLNATSHVEQFSTSLYNQHAYAIASYVYPLSYRIKFKPWVLARFVEGAPLSFDYAISIKVDDSYSLGLITRNLTTYGAYAQINIGDNLRFAYVFELPTQKSVGTQFTTHELTLGLRLKFLKFHDIDAVRNF